MTKNRSFTSLSILLMLFFSVFIAGCSYTTLEERSANMNLPEYDRMAVNNSRIYVGMPAEYVELAIGAPLNKNANRSIEHWYYRFPYHTYGSHQSRSSRAVVVIKNGRVLRVGGFPGRMLLPPPTGN